MDTDAGKFADIAQVITGVVSLGVAWQALLWSRRGTEQQHQLSLSTNRAYLVPCDAFVTQFQIGKPIEAQIGIQCWGQTPALDVIAQGRSYFANPANNHQSKLALRIEGKKAELIMPPGQKAVTGRIGKDDQPLTEHLLSQLISGEVAFFAELVAEYLDVAGNKHSTFIRYFLGKEGAKVGKVPMGMVIGHGALSVS